MKVEMLDPAVSSDVEFRWKMGVLVMQAASITHTQRQTGRQAEAEMALSNA